MKRLLMLMVCACLATACGVMRPTLAPSRPSARVEVSVRPLRAYPSGDVFCTAFSVNETAGYWMTAQHCTKDITPINATIDGHWAMVVYRDVYADIAILQSDLRVSALHAANHSAGVGESAVITGFPWGLPKTITYGHVSALNMPIQGVLFPSDLYDITVAPGNSGSPITDSQGQLIGLLWGRFTESNHAIAVPWLQVKRVVEMFR